jgi:hypothetical protein
VLGDENVEIVLIGQGVVDFSTMVVDSVEDLVEVEHPVDDGLGDFV